MRITRTDLALLLSMFLTVWLLTTVFASAGLASGDFNASDPPTLNLSGTDVDFIPTPPDPPLGTAQFRISDSPDESYPERRDLNSSTTIEVNDCADFGFAGCAWNYRLAIPDNNGGPALIQTNISTEGETAVLNYGDNQNDPGESWAVKIELEDNATGQSIISIQNSPSPSGFFGQIGALFSSATDFVGSAVSTIAYVIQGIIAFVFNAIATAVATAGAVGLFIISYTGYLFGGYIAISTSVAGGWATPVLVLPLVILSFEIAKIGFYAINGLDPLIPFT